MKWQLGAEEDIRDTIHHEIRCSFQHKDLTDELHSSCTSRLRKMCLLAHSMDSASSFGRGRIASGKKVDDRTGLGSVAKYQVLACCGLWGDKLLPTCVLATRPGLLFQRPRGSH